MKTFTFKGGIHPPEKKELAAARAIERAMPSTNTVVIPITQGGAPNTPIVAVGDVVAKGQIIAESDAFMSAPVHASVAGTVKKIEARLVTGNLEAPCVVIEADGTDKTDFLPPLDPFACTKAEALARVRAAGIVGMGGASFPTHVKLNPPADKPIEYVLANGAECEPYLTIDERVMLETGERVVDGLAIAMHMVGAAAGIIVLEDNKKHVVLPLREAIEKSGQKNITVKVVKTKYPQGGEKMLVKSALNREIPSGKLPADAGCVVQNVGTLCAISDAFRLGKPLIERALTVSGGRCETPKNLLVPVGTLVGDLIPEVITLKTGVAKIVSGGPMMGVSMMNANFPIQKNTSGVLFLGKDELSLIEESACLGCGFCVNACACRLTPVMIVRSLKANDLESAARYGLTDCVECGSCAYVCPAHVQLVQRIRGGKIAYRAELLRRKEEAQKEAAEAATSAQAAAAANGEKANGSSADGTKIVADATVATAATDSAVASQTTNKGGA